MANKKENSINCFAEEENSLLNALRSNNITKFKNILNEDKNIDLDHQFGDPDFANLIEIACSKENTSEFVKELLYHGANPNIVNELRKKSPIHSAIRSGDIETLKILVNNKSTNVNIQDSKGSSALHIAASQSNCEEKFKILLSRNDVDVNLCDRKGKTPLHYALKENKKNFVQLLLNHPNINLEIGDTSGNTLEDLVKEKYPNLKINKPSKIRGNVSVGELFSYLRMHQFDNFLEAIKSVDNSVLEQNDGTHTFLQYCCDFGIEKVAKELLFRDIDPNNTHSSNVRTPVMIAARKGFVTIVNMLINNKRTSFRPVNEETVLHYVIKGSYVLQGLGEIQTERNHYKCLTLLLEKIPRLNLNINQRDTRGNTALHYAAKYENHDMVLMLLKHGAYIGICNEQGDPACSDITLKTLKIHLDNCVYENDDVQKDDDYEIIFDYGCMIPYSLESKTLSNSESTEMIELGNGLEINENHLYNCETDPFLYMSKSRELRPLLSHPIITSYLYLKLQRVRKFIFINLFLYFFFMISLTFYIIHVFCHDEQTSNANDTTDTTDTIQKETKENYFLWTLLFIFLMFILVRELFQLAISPLKYFKNPENWLEICIISVSFYILFVSDSLYKHQISATAILLSWMEFILLVGSLPYFSTNIEMLKTVSLNFLKFLAWYSILIIAFALSFHSLFKDSNEENQLFETFYVSVFKTIVMLTGEFESGDIPFVKYPFISHILFILFVFLLAIVMLNLLNGLAVSDTQAIKADAELVGYVSRVKLLSYIEQTLSNPSTWFGKIFKNEMLVMKINLFQELSDSQIRIRPNDENKVKNLNDSKNRNCIDCLVYMDPDTVRSAKAIIERKKIDKEIEKEKEINAERQQLLGQMLDEWKQNKTKKIEDLNNSLILKCDDIIKQNKKILEILYQQTSFDRPTEMLE